MEEPTKTIDDKKEKDGSPGRKPRTNNYMVKSERNPRNRNYEKDTKGSEGSRVNRSKSKANVTQLSS